MESVREQLATKLNSAPDTRQIKAKVADLLHSIKNKILHTLIDSRNLRLCRASGLMIRGWLESTIRYWALSLMDAKNFMDPANAEDHEIRTDLRSATIKHYEGVIAAAGREGKQATGRGEEAAPGSSSLASDPDHEEHLLFGQEVSVKAVWVHDFQTVWEMVLARLRDDGEQELQQGEQQQKSSSTTSRSTIVGHAGSTTVKWRHAQLLVMQGRSSSDDSSDHDSSSEEEKRQIISQHPRPRTVVRRTVPRSLDVASFPEVHLPDVDDLLNAVSPISSGNHEQAVAIAQAELASDIVENEQDNRDSPSYVGGPDHPHPTDAHYRTAFGFVRAFARLTSLRQELILSRRRSESVGFLGSMLMRIMGPLIDRNCVSRLHARQLALPKSSML